MIAKTKNIKTTMNVFDFRKVFCYLYCRSNSSMLTLPSSGSSMLSCVPHDQSALAVCDVRNSSALSWYEPNGLSHLKSL
jgi:hypothetical protein